jgi:ring-1,2-phenylacetyl-CoA epoxidase subunit PaaE
VASSPDANLDHFTLRWMGFGEEQIKRETFNIEYIPPPPFLIDQTPKQVDLSFRGIRHQFKVSYPSSILEAALKNNIQLPYSCRGGRCSTCMAKCLSGKIKMSINEVLTDQDLQEGWVLTCVGFAETDIVLSFPQR